MATVLVRVQGMLMALFVTCASPLHTVSIVIFVHVLLNKFVTMDIQELGIARALQPGNLVLTAKEFVLIAERMVCVWTVLLVMELVNVLVATQVLCVINVM